MRDTRITVAWGVYPPEGTEGAPASVPLRPDRGGVPPRLGRRGDTGAVTLSAVRPLSPLLALALLGAGCSAVAGYLPATGLGEPAPSLALSDVRTGERVRLGDFAERAVLLNAWATWCGPCRAEMPELDRLQQERPDDLVVVFVSDEPPELIRAWLADRPTSGVYVHAAPEAFVGPYAAVQGARPVTFVIDAEGVLRERIIGAQTAETLRDRLDTL